MTKYSRKLLESSEKKSCTKLKCKKISIWSVKRVKSNNHTSILYYCDSCLNEFIVAVNKDIPMENTNV